MLPRLLFELQITNYKLQIGLHGDLKRRMTEGRGLRIRMRNKEGTIKVNVKVKGKTDDGWGCVIGSQLFITNS
jgi:hypothetical protein